MVPASVGLRGSGAGLREVLAPWRCGSICRSSTACSRVHLGARHRRPRPVFFRGPDPDPATDKHDGHRPASAPIIRSFRPPSPYRLPTPACPLTTRTGTAQTISCLRGGQATDHESFLKSPALREAGDSPDAAAATPRAQCSSDRPRGDLHRGRPDAPSCGSPAMSTRTRGRAPRACDPPAPTPPSDAGTPARTALVFLPSGHLLCTMIKCPRKRGNSRNDFPLADNLGWSVVCLCTSGCQPHKGSNCRLDPA